MIRFTELSSLILVLVVVAIKISYGQEECKDNNAPGRQSDCPLHFALCRDSVYREFMLRECPSTCKNPTVCKKEKKSCKEKETTSEETPTKEKTNW
ncbi:hypothetical protein M3Y98_01211900 [Aphelenchoides besseyi]|nr:hypothetical protein M3Y98_01211900 [Aphelenchoides besseyi]